MNFEDFCIKLRLFSNSVCHTVHSTLEFPSAVSLVLFLFSFFPPPVLAFMLYFLLMFLHNFPELLEVLFHVYVQHHFVSFCSIYSSMLGKKLIN